MMQSRTKIMSEMRLVGNLQDYGSPYASLFINSEDNGLYIFVRVCANRNDSSPKYIAIPSSADDVRNYMDRHTTLSSLVKKNPSTEATIHGKQVVMSLTASPSTVNSFHDENVFEPEFCHDKMKLKVFLRRYQSGEYNNHTSHLKTN